jgi:hypothetical protein
MAELPINDFPENYQIIDCLASVKCFTPDGDVVVFHRFTEGMNDHEALGRALTLFKVLENTMTFSALDGEGLMEDDEGEEGEEGTE